MVVIGSDLVVITTDFQKSGSDCDLGFFLVVIGSDCRLDSKSYRNSVYMQNKDWGAFLLFTAMPNQKENVKTTAPSNFDAEAFGDMFSTLYNQI